MSDNNTGCLAVPTGCLTVSIYTYFNKMEWSAEGLDSSNANQLQKRLNNLVLRGDHNGKKLQASF